MIKRRELCHLAARHMQYHALAVHRTKRSVGAAYEAAMMRNEIESCAVVEWVTRGGGEIRTNVITYLPGPMP